MKLFDVYPLFNITPVKAKGSYLWDEKGQKYLDLYGGHAVISIGHSHPHYVAKLTNQLNEIGFYSNSVQIPMQQQLATLLGQASGYDDYNLFLCNSGAEANENAIKLASFHTGKKKIISFSKSFHGRTSMAVAATDDKSIVAPVNETENIIFLPFNDEKALENAFDEQIAAVIIEGIQGVGGVNIPTESFLQKIKQLCQQFGAIMICDEIQSGYGRSGKFFAHQFANVRPDIITTAKGMGNGFPVAGVLISPEIKAKHSMLGTTFGGNYLAVAAAIAVLEVIKSENLVENAAKIGDYLVSQLQGIEGIKEIRALGLMVGIELDTPCANVRNTLLKEHFIFTGSASNKNTLRILPALNVTTAEIDIFVEAFKQVMITEFEH
ncbi:acetylornithine aminotransferase [Flexibacter flexilis DSM 6793]|uniref:Acetylornithine aminotransferase n=1 Tax=Flexibacter flexilis DSM 6793 TaxID=927664 RepID=A0A1I1F1V8_9BACT|nr:aminotransferase class III-fold pyridoxal phosphate-dependent enzyme [Flexibacter flexilis]SFB93429.1 acetylornithine aminotransferase [Flexibacter flexilis DSM 6793]